MIYSILKDFAGPIATIIASITAVYFVRRQWRTAQQQADTAVDQLRYSLFEKRYAIYAAARKAIAITFDKRDEDKMPDELNGLFLNFEESRFLLPGPHTFISRSTSQRHKDIPPEELSP